MRGGVVRGGEDSEEREGRKIKYLKLGWLAR
jgi:hypothetical protein